MWEVRWFLNILHVLISDKKSSVKEPKGKGKDKDDRKDKEVNNNMKKAPGPGIDLSTMRKEVFQPKEVRDVDCQHACLLSEGFDAWMIITVFFFSPNHRKLQAQVFVHLLAFLS